MKSKIFVTNAYQEIETKAKDLLNSQSEFLTPATVASTRAAGDAIQTILAESFETILGKWSATYSAAFARRAMADFAFQDDDGFYYVVDVKTHRTDTAFNMPNLISVERLARFYEDDNNYFALLLVRYHLEATRVVVTHVAFTPIEFIGWDCLTIGALG